MFADVQMGRTVAAPVIHSLAAACTAACLNGVHGAMWQVPASASKTPPAAGVLATIEGALDLFAGRSHAHRKLKNSRK